MLTAQTNFCIAPSFHYENVTATERSTRLDSNNFRVVCCKMRGWFSFSENYISSENLIPPAWLQTQAKE